ncbi:MAG: hypothetical protein FWB78_07260 [Treponema sp.]|nr:hypothetical protein [Treponema sp.]
MNSTIWDRFAKTREYYRNEIERMWKNLPELQAIQQKLVDSRSPTYQVETPIVYNGSLDDVNRDDEIRLILVADNPGRREQAAENRRYLVGPSGKIAEKFFRDNPVLNIDFRKNVIILNKTPIHTPRTVELRELCKLGGISIETALAESQRLMVRLLVEFQQAFACENDTVLPVWLTGYSEMKKGGVFEVYTNELKNIYGTTAPGETIFLYRHFSMNQFTIDLKRQALPGEALTQTLERIGTVYRQRFLF